MKLNFILTSLIIVLLLTSSPMAFGQGNDNKQLRIERVGKNFAALKNEADKRVVAFLKQNKDLRLQFKSRGATYLLVDVTGSGIPVYEKTDNDGVATSLNVKKLRAGGSLGVNILGTGMRVGLWDGGAVLGEHVELIGRVIQQDGAVNVDDHATHVMGTMIASGVNTSAKGMAPEATALAYDFSGDVSEMTSMSKPDQTTLLLSNHSYGTVSGWNLNGNGTWSWLGDINISTTVDYKFGYYDSKSSAWDDLAFNAPYYTIVKSAGNDRSDVGDGTRPPDGPFDCIPTFGVAKNIITVGAVKKLAGAYTGPNDVEMTDFSSWGPTDDGRIKPDIVAPGQNVFSSTAVSTNSYSAFEGTSMATPAVTGTLALLQQLYKGLNTGNYMRSSTLKAVVIHSARETGTAPGPDYAYGWGLLDAEAAAKLIIDKDNQNIFIKEGTLNNGQVYELELSPEQNMKITATLVWTDPAGTAPVPSLNPSAKMLVNDLDLRLVDDGGTQQFPWTLNPATPSAGAVAADNSRDNVEKIEFANPDPRTYKIRVTHKGNLKNNQPQNYSLVVTYTSIIDTKTTYYWIGGGGNWNDGTHWSLSSGGPTANLVPGQDDRVVFDENSFSAAATVNLTQNQNCYSLRWFATEAIDLAFNNHTLNVYENVLLVSDKVKTPSNGTLYFHGSSTLHQLDLDGNVLDKLGLVFDGNATWELTGDFSAEKVRILQGTVNILNAHPKLDSIMTSGPLTKKLKLDNTLLKPLQTLRIYMTPTGAGSVFESINSSIQVTPTAQPMDLNFGPNNVETHIALEGGEVILSGTGELRKISGNGKLQLNSNLKIKEVSLAAGSQLTLKEGSQPQFTDDFILAGVNGNKVLIKTTGVNTASLAFDNYYKICFDFLDIQNVAISGQSIVNAGTNSTLSNAANWFQENCNDILFPDFTVQFNCVKASTYFKDVSSGTITTRAWNFGDAGSTQNQSSLKDPIHYFAAGGTYSVSLEIGNGTKTQKVTKQIQLLNNTLTDNKVELNNGLLISFQPAQSYQWVVDGTIVEGATGRTTGYEGKPGEYAVLTFDDTCNKRSDTYLITALEDQILLSPSIMVYPNPASEKIMISKPSGRTIQDIQLGDALGREIKVPLEESETEILLSVQGVIPGLYILKIQTSKGAEVHKVIIR